MYTHAAFSQQKSQKYRFLGRLTSKYCTYRIIAPFAIMNTSESITERPAVRTRTSASTAFATVAFVSLMSWHSLSEARIYKCVANDGSISYSQSECSYKEKTAKVMSSKGRGKSNIDCSIAEGFIRETSNQMRNGMPSGEVFAQYGGLNRVTSVVGSIVNYIYTYAGNLTTTADRVYDLSLINI